MLCDVESVRIGSVELIESYGILVTVLSVSRYSVLECDYLGTVISSYALSLGMSECKLISVAVLALCDVSLVCIGACAACEGDTVSLSYELSTADLKLCAVGIENYYIESCFRTGSSLYCGYLPYDSALSNCKSCS